MAKNKLRLLAPAISLLGATIMAPIAMAADSTDYGIVYSGGAELGAGNTIENPELVASLQPIMKHRDVTISVSDSAKWQKGYLKEAGDKCLAVNYIEVSDDNSVVDSDNVSFTITKNEYSAEVDITSITTVNLSDGQKTAVGVLGDADFVYAGWQIYTDNQCSTVVPDFSTNFGIRPAENDRVFVNMNIKLFRGNKPYIHDGIFFGITDVDAAQSYKILNEDNLLTSSNMFVKSYSDLQDPDNPLKNMFVSSGNYIYSEYDADATPPTIGLPEISNIYVPLTTTTQTNGLDVVFGFASGAASGIEYYSHQFDVTYTSDDNGTISGIKEEEVFPMENPSGSETTPAEGYELSYWTANKDIILDDGTEIKKGKPITEEQVKHIVVTEDITLTAVHEKVVLPPDTGIITKEDNGATAISVSIIGLAAVAIISFYLPRINHKKVNFDRK